MNACIVVSISIPSMICKLDIEKAYDHISFDECIYLLGRMGSGEKWNGWIRSCIYAIHSFLSSS